ncbi:uncharacterized protein [Nicotiana tomentosiformis]|uniref:uncharacterized protein isoform X1 n=1 Tax=Nicotiana tomentosiformis TaxID=4098 RepID=UPI00051B4A76|nr:nucleolar protein dao-5-like isoform X1 [Nicotiana tomentosiformis]XP_009608417.1 nucleolar protein dao-5-like isoform X1 [Nicotiana tomentosiformis]XP_009608418.1 nucleolar protein dao-5-like isoform X1 [Nicotiana tomentosiformis]XP_018628421.1 nucleolar protein dao-5-like isoform X1 [Nicotiana tomentosiformis]
MEGGVDADVLLEYVEFQIFPSRGRYEAHMCYGKKVEAASSGLLEQLVLHSPKIKSLHYKGSDSSFKFKPLGNLSDAKWFTNSTLIRFLRIINSLDIIDVAKAMVNEISQLEDARKFHVSLYSKGHEDHVGSRETAGSSYSNSAASTVDADDHPSSSDASKNELLRAMDLRLAALTGELAAVFDKAVGTKCSFEDITNIEKFSYYFGAVDLRYCLQKIVALQQENVTGAFPAKEPSLSNNDVRTEKIGPEGRNCKTSRASKSDTAVKYRASPAKAAQLERQISSASEESSSTSEEEQPAVARSRTLMRSASPRRSASPMRRVQIGRSGSRRSTALTIKSLNFFPARERSFSHKDESASDNDDGEECEKTSKKSENNVQRISVQDAINLFERKQRGQTVDFQKTKPLLNVSVANKAVLRRWSSGVCERANPVNVASRDPAASLASNKLEDHEIESASEMNPESHPTPESYDAEAADNDCKPNLPQERASSPEEKRKESLPNQYEETSEKLNASVEWTRKKEAELNQLLMKMMETKPTKYQNLAPSDSKLQRLSNECRGGFYDHYKEKRDEKLRGETTRKQGEKEKQIKALQQKLDERKAEMVSRNASSDNKKSSIKRTQKAVKNLFESANPRSGTLKPAVVKKVPLKPSTLPATRKSWSSAPSPRAAGISPAIPAGPTPTRRISQPVPTATKVEILQRKTGRATQHDTKKSVKGVSEKKLETVTKTSKPRRSKVQPASEDSAFSVKPKLSKVTKRSSVVPLESKEPKPFLRKGSGIGSGLSPVRKVKVSSQPEECVADTVDLVQMEEEEMASVSFDPVNQLQDRGLEDLEVHEDKDSETQSKNPQICENTERFDKVTPNDTDDFGQIEDSTTKTKVEGEPNISPSAWVEIEEHEDQSIPSNGDFCNNESLDDVAPVRVSSPRVRHSLSQMLLEDNRETDVIDWGNAENPPTMVYQKDAPKGLKRLLKFTRKSKNDANSTGFSSLSIFSEGEDDLEDSKILTKRSSDNLLKKATLHAKNVGRQKSSSSEVYELSAPNGIGRFSAQKLQESHISVSVTTTKATRSFFSLSAFKGSKQNDAKLR